MSGFRITWTAIGFIVAYNGQTLEFTLNDASRRVTITQHELPAEGDAGPRIVLDIKQKQQHADIVNAVALPFSPSEARMFTRNIEYFRIPAGSIHSRCRAAA